MAGKHRHFTHAFNKYIRIDVSCKQLNDDNPHELVDGLIAKLPGLCQSLVVESIKETRLILWPSLFVFCKADAIISREAHQDRGTILIGVENESDEDIEPMLRRWERDLRSSILFIDYEPTPQISICSVRGQDLGPLSYDSWIHPELLKLQPTVFSQLGSSTDNPELLGIVPPSPPSASKLRPSATAAAEEGKRSVSPGTRAKFAPIAAILNRLKWDSAFDSRDFMVVYEDRHNGLMERPVDAWDTESTEETFIPMHRIRAVKRKVTGMVVWHREERIDLISGY